MLVTKRLFLGSMLLFFAGAFCWIGDSGWSQQPPKPKQDITISVASTKDPNVFTIALRNVGQRGLSVVLGDVCTGTIGAVRYRLISAGVDIDFEEWGYPCGGNTGPLVADLTPGGSYVYDLHLNHTTLPWDEALMRAVTAGKHFYMLQALLGGQFEENDWAKELPKGVGKYTLWRGKAASECIPFPSPESPDWRGFVARGGSLGNMLCQAH